MQNRDCGQVAALHARAMGDSLWARLGTRFLSELYRGLVDSPHFLGFVYEDPGSDGIPTMQGFIAGSTDTSRMMREVFISRWMVLGLAAIPGLLRAPWLARHLATTGGYSAASEGEDGVCAESLFCSFAPELRGKRISGHINKVLFDDLLARGHQAVKVTTESDNEGANRQLLSWGFERHGTFRFYGKDMVRYILDLEASERVEAVSRHPAV
jgi:RimJ/RimL family protein N-acetyltransferase